MNDCDALLMLGTDFPYRQFYPEHGVRIAQIDLRPENLGRRAPVDLGLVGDVDATLAALLPRLEAEDATARISTRRAQHYAKARQGLDALASGTPGRRPDPSAAGRQGVSDCARDDAIFTCDVGMPTVWAARYLAMNGKRRLIGSFWHGSMANAMPQAIGAQAAFPRPPGHLAVGRRRLHHADGRFPQPGAAELAGEGRRVQQRHARLRRDGDEGDRLPRYRHRSQEPELRRHGRGGRHQGRPLEDPAEVEPGLREALAHDGPALVDAVVNRRSWRCRPRSPPRWPRASASTC